MAKELVYSNYLNVDKLKTKNYIFTAQIATYGYKHKFLWFTWYTIKQSIPYIHEAVFDCEFDTNTILSIRAKEEYAKAEIEIEKLKINTTKC